MSARCTTNISFGGCRAPLVLQTLYLVFPIAPLSELLLLHQSRTQHIPVILQLRREIEIIFLRRYPREANENTKIKRPKTLFHSFCSRETTASACVFVRFSCEEINFHSKFNLPCPSFIFSLWEYLWASVHLHSFKGPVLVGGWRKHRVKNALLAGSLDDLDLKLWPWRTILKSYESLSKFAADRLLWAVQSLYWVLIANPGTQEKISNRASSRMPFCFLRAPPFAPRDTCSCAKDQSLRSSYDSLPVKSYY